MISREQYKNIKKMDHAQMDSFIRTFSKNMESANSEQHRAKFDELSNIYAAAIVDALNNTKGIGVKTKTNFIEQFNNIIKDKVSGQSLVVIDERTVD